ncbi:hypothetical protein SR882_05020 [Guyparkeria halophila]|uniref:Outer membrane beta-barrel protein n=1 Tax=Guyparkeria halophila TaxID=47960 RepID=A0ABZ0Z1A7_9GAMM|nr:hypothetical protein [Guyparkeria halophila]WQH17267.1 hypothetical protein SR882_05020 [Guyparkeria halophila]
MWKKSLSGLAAVTTLASGTALAGVDKVYDPYVEQGEVELEARGVHGLDSGEYKTKVGIGYGVTSRWFVEGYLIGEKEDGDFEVEEGEIENKFQLAEQGQYWADFGLLVELEKAFDEDAWETKVGPLVQKQFGDVVATGNLLFEKKFGDDVAESDWETLGSAQLKYRLSEMIEPGIEYYGSEDTQALGPVLLGANPFGMEHVKWEAGLLFALNDETEDSIFRWQLEYEF